jgi:hypothetical protein
MRALARATRVLPCPSCGWYQADMVARMRADQGGAQLALGTVGLSVGGLAGLLALVSLLASAIVGAGFMSGLAMVITAAIAVALLGGGIAALVWRGRVQRAFDPNTAAHVLTRRAPPPDESTITRAEYEQLVVESAERGEPLPIQGIDWPQLLPAPAGIAEAR